MLLGVVAAIVIFGVVIHYLYKNPEKRIKAIVFFSGVILFLYAALRGNTIGNDTYQYIVRYISNSKYELEVMLSMINELKDPGYQLAAWGFSKIFSNPQWWLAFIAAVYTILVMKFIRKYSCYPIISVLAFIAFGYFSFSLSGLRQTLAMALTLYSIKFIEQKKLVKFILIVLLASTFHTSAVIFFIAYPLTRFRIGYKHIVAFAIVGVMFFGFQSQVRSYINFLFADNRLAQYADKTTSLTASGFIIQLCVFLFCVFYYRRSDRGNVKLNILMNLSFIGLCFQIYATMIAEVFRVSMYFSIANIVLIPIAISLEKNVQIRQIVLFTVFIILFMYIFRDGIPTYSFFWK